MTAEQILDAAIRACDDRGAILRLRRAQSYLRDPKSHARALEAHRKYMAEIESGDSAAVAASDAMYRECQVGAELADEE